MQNENVRIKLDKRDGDGILMIIRTMNEKDLSEVVRLEVENFSDPWSEQSLKESMNQTFALCLVAEMKMEIVGCFIFYQSLDEGEILRIAVKKGYQHSGIGTALIKQMDSYCEQFKIRRVMLDVRKSNLKAIKFYKKQGFVPDGMRKHFYANPMEDAILMSRRI